MVWCLLISRVWPRLAQSQQSAKNGLRGDLDTTVHDTSPKRGKEQVPSEQISKKGGNRTKFKTKEMTSPVRPEPARSRTEERYLAGLLWRNLTPCRSYPCENGETKSSHLRLEPGEQGAPYSRRAIDERGKWGKEGQDEGRRQRDKKREKGVVSWVLWCFHSPPRPDHHFSFLLCRYSACVTIKYLRCTCRYFSRTFKNLRKC